MNEIDISNFHKALETLLIDKCWRVLCARVISPGPVMGFLPQSDHLRTYGFLIGLFVDPLSTKDSITRGILLSVTSPLTSSLNYCKLSINRR